MRLARTLAALALALAGGCGWHSGLLAPAGARSVGVAVAQRGDTVLERGLEARFTDALSEKVSDWVDLRLAAPAEADLVLRSTVLEYRRRGGVRSLENELVETAVRVRVEGSLFDRRTGKLVAGPVRAGQWSGYSPDPDDPQVERAAADRSLRHAAESLVLALFDPSPAASRPDAPLLDESEPLDPY